MTEALTVTIESVDDIPVLLIPATRLGLLYVGDCKLMALATRAHLAAGGDDYLAPLALTHLPQAAIDAYLQPVWAQEQALTPVYRDHPTEGFVKIAEGFECAEQLTATVAGRTITWTERRLVVRSLQQAAAATVALPKGWRRRKQLSPS